MATNIAAVFPSASSRGSSGSKSRVHIPSSSFDIITNWTVRAVRSAIRTHKLGDFSLSSLLAQDLLDDAEIFSGTKTRASAFSARNGLPFHIEPSDADGRRNEAVAARQQRLWWMACPESEIEAMERDTIFLGASIARDDLQLFEGEWIPKLRRLRPHGMYWSEAERVMRYIDGDGRNHIVTPGENGWVLHMPQGLDSWLYGAIRALGMPFIFDMLALRDWCRYTERHGMPALAVKEPFWATDDVDKTPGGSKAHDFYRRAARLASGESTLRLQQGENVGDQGWDVEWLELKSRSYETFSLLLKEIRRRIVAVLLGRDIESSSAVGGDGASFLDRVRGEYLASEAEALSTTLRNQVWMPDTVRNVTATKPEVTGWPRWDTRAKEDLAKRATTLNVAAEAIDKLEKLGVDVVPVIEELGLKRIRKPDPPAAPPQPPPSPANEAADPEPPKANPEETA